MRERDDSGDGLQIQLAIDAPSSVEDLASLRRWLDADADAQFRLASRGAGESAAPGSRMGGVIDLINIAVTDAAALTSTLMSVLTWRSSRAKHPEILVMIADRPAMPLTESVIEQITTDLASHDAAPKADDHP